MGILAAINHVTSYRYEKRVSLGPQTVRLRPAPHSKTPIKSYSLKISPEKHFLNWQQDPQGNWLARLVFPEKVDHFRVEVDLVAELAVYNPFDFFIDDDAKELPFDYTADQRHELTAFLGRPEHEGPKFREYIDNLPDRKGANTLDYLVELNRLLEQHVKYNIRMEPGVQSPEKTLTLRNGSCRDTSWLLVNILREIGLAARFVSGYLIQLTPDQKSLDGPSGTEVDFTDLHAWAEVYLPGAGWVGFDPTSGLLASEGHIPVACTPTPTTAAPISGGVEPSKTQFDFEMTIQRVREHPRVTRPYSDDDWNAVMQLGQQIDERLERGDVRLTMGGEPTFVSIDDPDGPEWNISAVGPLKKSLCNELLRRLYKRWAPHGFLHHGQGKWYPGESLPRWAYTCIWRKDGEPLWQHPELLADVETDYGYGPDDAKRFTEHLTGALGISARYARPAYEDVWYYIWKERKLPTNVDPLDSRLKDEEERERLAHLFEKGLDEPRGFVLPIRRQWWQSKPRWVSGWWHTRQEKLYLIPGDSPIGLRLPLDTLPWVSENDYPYINDPDPTVPPTGPLPGWEERYREYYQRAIEFAQDYDERPGDFGPRPQRFHKEDEVPDRGKEQDRDREPAAFESAGWVVRTALCVEAKAGKLFIFMPPVEKAQDYLDLLHAIEATAVALDMPVVIEGERPPFEETLEHFRITPDPGVIEVNVHPARNWQELVDNTYAIYDDARETRLGTDKFMIDGRHTGTGGGNHIVIGGAKPVDSPFLRRPDLLRSMVAYWHQHPSLSYLFSGLFIGPTSQAPRVDEARDDSLYELEIAFKEIDLVGPNPQFWMTDRIFRNLLIDVTGNTHRAEFCIDKLYSPDTPTGRLGLVELRSFEMPPHARMSLAQQVLIRALIALFWEKPYRPTRLTRWGTQLHDRWMLPHFVWNDFREVLAELRENGFAFDENWFHAHKEFRFPFYGEIDFNGIHLELRNALEPWHVMGEEGMAGSAVRFVDSSVERLQVFVSGLNADRYMVTANGRRVPLTSTGRQGEFVAGVRYRAWQPGSSLHPTIKSNAPVVVDIVDTWNARSVAGCTYHVAHPGGKAYDTFPINSYEAESRRLARFQPHGHTGGRWSTLPTDEPSEEFPCTLDLRRF